MHTHAQKPSEAAYTTPQKMLIPARYLYTWGRVRVFTPSVYHCTPGVWLGTALCFLPCTPWLYMLVIH